ncbi:MAG: YbhB/YbcL family Raf kinase inhibitor-like protein [Thermoanaerobaculia bacterium]|nr:YbhB/YbcL family Raf kinase inhibitor-like protein [Thermoanaerobaculia bacterium]
MKISSRSIAAGACIPPTYAMGVPGTDGPVPGPNKSPHLAWAEFPPETKSFAIVCHDPDVPSRGDDVNKAGRVVPYDLPRVDFYHWLLIDIAPSTTELAEGVDSDGIVPKGKRPGRTAIGVRGINDYTSWFGDDPDMGGDYGGYDGPWPPFNDERLHHYHFTVYALDVPSLGLPEKFRGPGAMAAMKGHVLDKAELIGTYALNPTAR